MYKNKFTIVAIDEYGQTITGNYGDYTISKDPDNAGSSVEKGSTIYLTCHSKDSDSSNNNSNKLDGSTVGSLGGQNLQSVYDTYSSQYKIMMKSKDWKDITTDYSYYTVEKAWLQGSNELWVQTKETLED